jgi:hypothetical protein
MALVLLMEGINQVFVWSHIVEDLNIEINKVINIPANATAEETFTTVDGIVNYVFNHFPSTADLYQQTQTALAEFAPTSNATQDEQNVAGVTIFTDLCQIIFEGFGWAVPNTDANLPQTGNLEERVTLFTEQYYYVFSISFGTSEISLILKFHGRRLTFIYQHTFVSVVESSSSASASSLTCPTPVRRIIVVDPVVFSES